MEPANVYPIFKEPDFGGEDGGGWDPVECPECGNQHVRAYINSEDDSILFYCESCDIDFDYE